MTWTNLIWKGINDLPEASIPYAPMLISFRISLLLPFFFFLRNGFIIHDKILLFCSLNYFQQPYNVTDQFLQTFVLCTGMKMKIFESIFLSNVFLLSGRKISRNSVLKVFHMRGYAILLILDGFEFMQTGCVLLNKGLWK